MVPPVKENRLAGPQKVKHRITTILLLVHIQEKENRVHTKICTRTFIVALLIRAKKVETQMPVS